MKSFALISLGFLAGAIASPLRASFGYEQLPLSLDEPLSNYDGFDLDLNAPRLVQMEGQEPVWMTELEKVYHNHLNGTFHDTNILYRSKQKLVGLSSSTCTKITLPPIC
jgi:hypothetical protein